MLTIKQKPKEYLNEIFQSLDIKFSFVNKDLEEITTKAKCRDFLIDVLLSNFYNKPVDIYGFKYDFKKDPYDLDTLSLLLTFPSVACKNIFLSRVKELNIIEKSIGVSTSVIYKVKGYSNQLVIEADKLWQSAPYKISLYTFYIKRFSVLEDKDLKNPDKGYLEVLLKKNNEEFLLSSIKKDVKVHHYDETYLAHNRSGFVSIVTENAEEQYNLIKEAK